MKKIFLVLSLFFPLFSALLLAEEAEIIIEMQGSSSPSKPHILWDSTAPQLTLQFKNKTRDEILYAMPIVSHRDQVIQTPSDKYSLVEYTDGEKFRKFLFHYQYPQKLIAVAATVADVLAINKKYQVNIGLSEQSFKNFYASEFSAEKSSLLPTRANLYKLSYQDINTPVPTDRWFLFEEGKLTLTFENEESKNAYLNNLRPPMPPVEPPPPPSKRPVHKALISGGTVKDQMYMPRVVDPKTLPSALTPKTPNPQTN